MSFYQRYVLPRLLHLAMRNPAATAERRRFVPLASGTVLEVGAGSGLNLPFYRPDLARLYALEPSAELWRLARPRVAAAPFPVEVLPAPAEAIPLPDAAMDTVVSTWTLCTIADPVRALREIQRVLRPAGRLVFVEHGRAPEPRVTAWQDRLDPVWWRIAGGCHMNRAIDRLLVESGFRPADTERGYVGPLKILEYLYRGVATRPG